MNYPKWKHCTDGKSRLIRSEEEEAALGPEWGDQPCDPPKAEEPKPTVADCPNCARLLESFNNSWDGLTSRHAKLEEDFAGLQAEHDGLRALHMQIVTAHAELTGEHAQLADDHRQLISEHEALKSSIPAPEPEVPTRKKK
jgi:hypothetical protein